MILKKIQTFISTRLRRILEIRRPETISNRERTKQQLREDEILQRHWRRIGHTLRKSMTCITRQAFAWNPQGKRKQGRQRNSWRRDLEALVIPGDSLRGWPKIGMPGELLLLVGCLTSQKHASVSQGRICSDKFTCCHTEIEVADQTFHLTQSQYTDTGPTSPSADPITPGAWQGSHWSANF